MTRLLQIAGFMVVFLVSAHSALADSSADATEQPALVQSPEGKPLTAEEARPIAIRVASKLRCPVCQGLSVSDSSSKAAVMMYNKIQGQFEEGYTEDQVVDYWIARYGEWVLLEPTDRHWIVWAGPVLAGGLGLVWLSVTLFGRKKTTVVAQDAPDGDTADSPTLDRYQAQLIAEIED